ncbi:MAG: hypothetical protein AAGI66_09055 [Cyanobacteria bacterium P01_H01_bin.74]
MSITFKLNSSEFNTWADQKVKRQLPFALAKALTKTSQTVQTALRKELPREFTIRNNWIAKGIRIKPAKKKTLEAAVFSIDNNIGQQVHGGIKKPQKGNSLSIAASSKGRINVRTGKNSKGKIIRSLKPSALLDKPNLYFRSNKIGNIDAIWKRTGRKDKKGWPRPYLNLMYVMQPNVKLKPRYKFPEITEHVALETLPVQVDKALDLID